MGAWRPGRGDSWLYWLVFTVDTCWLRRRDSLVVAVLCLFISWSMSRESRDIDHSDIHVLENLKT
jgi:hypothetical protein